MSKERHYDKDGKYAGWSERDGTKERHYDKGGKKTGWSEWSGDKARHYDKDGKKAGWSEWSGEKGRHYDKDGKRDGWSERSGDKTRHYDKDGKKDGWSEKSSGGGCFITTACVEAKGLPDDCEELNTLRIFRDEFVCSLPEGDRIIQEYYEIAPRILAGISKTANSNDVYVDLYERLVKKSLELISADKKDEAYANYLLVVNELRERYL